MRFPRKYVLIAVVLVLLISALGGVALAAMPDNPGPPGQQGQIDELTARVETLEALLVGVTRSGDDLTFPHNVHAENVIVDDSLFALDGVFAVNVFADSEISGTGDFIDGGVPLNVP